MPLLEKETDLYPEDLFDLSFQTDVCDSHWWGLYTLSRREKQLMRRLLALGVPFFGPVIERRYRSPQGRMRRSYEPLFSNYVFIFASFEQRSLALSTNCISRCYDVKDGAGLTEDLRRIYRLIQIGRPLTPESRLLAGDRVRVKTGMFAGFEGSILRREGETRLLVSVNFTQQGASVLLDDCQLESI